MSVQAPMKAKWKKYESYKDTGVEWIGEIPEVWDVIRLKFLKNGSFNYGANESAELDDPSLPRYIRITDITSEGKLREDTFRSLPINVALPYMLDDEDILLARSGATVGKAFIYNSDWGPACYAGYLIRLKPRREKFMAKYIWYFTQSNSYWSSIKVDTIQATIQNFSAEKYANIAVSIPDITEQKSIINFLDRETSKLDDLVSKKQRLVSLLQEKRQALISSAVTKGLNPDVKMKDSGIKWLGEVPEHWDILKLKTIVHLKSGSTINYTDIDDDSEYPVYGGNGLRGFSKSYTHNGEFILIGRQGAHCGNIHLVRGSFWASEHAVVATLVNNVNISWLEKLLVTMDLNQYSESAAQPGISVEKIKNLYICIPTQEEQIQIADFLDNKLSKIQQLIETIQVQIIKIQEYRQTLITAAVTGQIDVREEATA
jgi:type I restriction enzyme S subunit